jgi:molybdate transport system substrate-binding protein
MRKATAILSVFIIACSFLGNGLIPKSALASEKNILSVSAAASLKDALKALEIIYAEKNPGMQIEFNFASSGLLQKQIEQGAPVDLFISAGKRQMDELNLKGLIVPSTCTDLLSNRMVLIVSREMKNTIRSFNDLVSKAKSFSIGTPEYVPAGKYGKETLVSLKLWDKLKNRIVFAKDVRQVLAYVDSGNVDAGLVYKSDTVVLKSAVMVAEAPEGSHALIVYPMAIVKGAKNPSAAERFMEFLKTPEASKIFKQYMFIPFNGKR